MKMAGKSKPTGVSPANGGSVGGGCEELEVRPGGMLVQKRSTESNRNVVAPPTIRVRVKFGGIYHEISISSQATFGELKKMLTGPTRLHHQDQKLIFKDKERDSMAFLDVAGVKDRSKIVLVEDAISQEKRFLEMRRNAKMEKASKSILEISLEIDRLAGQVSALESIICKGGKVDESNVLNLIEMLMNQLLKLDGVIAEGDVKLQRKMQVRRVQKYVETLDMLKIKNTMPSSNVSQIPIQNQHKHSNGNQRKNLPIHQQQQRQQQQQPPRHSASGTPLVSTKWETFDSTPVLTPPTTAATPTSTATAPKFNWEFFD